MATCNDCFHFIYTSRGECQLYPFMAVDSYTPCCGQFVDAEAKEINDHSTKIYFKDGSAIEYSSESTVTYDNNKVYVSNPNGDTEHDMSEVKTIERL